MGVFPYRQAIRALPKYFEKNASQPGKKNHGNLDPIFFSFALERQEFLSCSNPVESRFSMPRVFQEISGINQGTTLRPLPTRYIRPFDRLLQASQNQGPDQAISGFSSSGGHLGRTG
jgi:hypothetical protein